MRLDGAAIGTLPVTNGAVSGAVTVPSTVTPGAHTLEIVVAPSGTTVRAPLTVEAAETPVVEAGDPVIEAGKQGIKPGAKLTVDPGQWTEGAELSFQWLADGEPIAGATGEQFHLTGKYKGKTITVRVTGTLEGHEPATAVSEGVRI